MTVRTVVEWEDNDLRNNLGPKRCEKTEGKVQHDGRQTKQSNDEVSEASDVIIDDLDDLFSASFSSSYSSGLSFSPRTSFSSAASFPSRASSASRASKSFLQENNAISTLPSADDCSLKKTSTRTTSTSGHDSGSTFYLEEETGVVCCARTSTVMVHDSISTSSDLRDDSSCISTITQPSHNLDDSASTSFNLKEESSVSPNEGCSSCSLNGSCEFHRISLLNLHNIQPRSCKTDKQKNPLAKMWSNMITNLKSEELPDFVPVPSTNCGSISSTSTSSAVKSRVHPLRVEIPKQETLSDQRSANRRYPSRPVGTRIKNLPQNLFLTI